jgi:hypothetical protein
LALATLLASMVIMLDALAIIFFAVAIIGRLASRGADGSKLENA